MFFRFTERSEGSCKRKNKGIHPSFFLIKTYVCRINAEVLKELKCYNKCEVSFLAVASLGKLRRVHLMKAPRQRFLTQLCYSNIWKQTDFV